MAEPVSLRLAAQDEDLGFLSALARDPAVEPYLAPGRGEPAALAELGAPASEPPQGVYVIETTPDSLKPNWWCFRRISHFTI